MPRKHIPLLVVIIGCFALWVPAQWMNETSGLVHQLSWIPFIIGCILVAIAFERTKGFTEWRKRPQEDITAEEFGVLLSDRIGAALNAAEMDQRLVGVWERATARQRIILYDVMNQAKVLEESVFRQAMQRDNLLEPQRIVSMPSTIPMQVLAAEPPPERAPEAAPPESTTIPVAPPAPSNVVTLSSAQWINGQLVRTG